MKTPSFQGIRYPFVMIFREIAEKCRENLLDDTSRVRQGSADTWDNPVFTKEQYTSLEHHLYVFAPKPIYLFYNTLIIRFIYFI